METESGEVVVGGGKFGKFGNLIRGKEGKGVKYRAWELNGKCYYMWRLTY
jgi:hypothetical protein